MRYTNQRVTSYDLLVNILASCVYCTSYELYFYCTSYILHASYKLLYIAQVTSYRLLHELQVTFAYELPATVYCTNYELLFICELRVVIN